MSHMDMGDMDMSGDGGAKGWYLMQDGSLYLMVNRQGGPAGGRGFAAPNWWMGMATRKAGPGILTLTGMVSLDPATVGTKGYPELFQVGEALDGKPIIDRQHPHDAWMQASASWRVDAGHGNGLTLAGGLSGEPALGPVAFMHRASSAAIPLAPLGHHTFDSTHVVFGVATFGVGHGPLSLEASVFNGREPDQHRWNLDLGRMDSLSARVWYRPAASWELQASTGHLIEPEQLHGGNVERTTASASYMSGAEDRFTAASFGFGMNATDEVTRHAVFGEATVSRGRLVGSLRLELVEVESELLRTGALPATTAGEAAKARVGAFTLGAVRDVVRGAYGTFGLGANLTAYAVPSVLQSTHGSHPVSFQVFAQLRPAAGAMGRMWNMRMAGPPMPMPGGMAGHRTR